jgi:hypothetical protein
MSLKSALLRKIFRRYFRWRLPDVLEQDEYPLILSYVDFPPAEPSPRYGFGKPPHPRLYDIVNSGRSRFAHELARLRDYRECFTQIPIIGRNGSSEACWSNDYFTDLDAMALYGMLARMNPRLYVEIGSGNSTRFARRAIHDHCLRTRIIAIDPMPRAEIKEICDEVITTPLERLELSILDGLNGGDFLFVDNSHLAMANSDVTTFFLDIFPRLKRKTVVHLHDILLPYDYPPAWSRRYYSEQYLLACYLLAMPEAALPTLLLANAFISQDAELDAHAVAICDGTNLDRALDEVSPQRRWSPRFRGLSFWMQMN